jgi:hypothetical protein
MGWLSEVESELQDAAKGVNEHPKNSLGWLLSAEKWNHWAVEAVSEGNDWEEVGFPIEEMPTNCEWEREEDAPIIKIPSFDLSQVLREAHDPS